MNALKTMALIGALLGASALSAQAATQTFTYNIAQTQTPFTDTFTLPAFDPALGTLTGVEVTAAWSGVANVSIINTTGVTQTFTNATVSNPVSVSITLSGLTWTGTDTLTAAVASGNLTSFANNFPGLPLTSSTLGNPIPPLSLADFEGAALTIPFVVTGDNGSYSGTSVSGVYFGGSATVGGDVDIEYTYSNTVPEPATWAMMGLGFAGLAFAGYRTRRSAISIA